MDKGRTEVVRDDDNTSDEALDGGSESVDRLHVKMVGRLIEEDDRGVLHRELGEDDSITKTVRELRDGRGLVRSRETESTELRSPELDVLVGELLVEDALEVLERRLVVRELVGRVLRVLGKLKGGVSRDGSLGGGKVSGDEVEKGRLSSSVV